MQLIQARASKGGQYLSRGKIYFENWQGSILRPAVEWQLGVDPKYLGKSRQAGKRGF